MNYKSYVVTGEDSPQNIIFTLGFSSFRPGVTREGTAVLNIFNDQDYNRSVITIVASVDSIGEYPLLPGHPAAPEGRMEDGGSFRDLVSIPCSPIL